MERPGPLKRENSFLEEYTLWKNGYGKQKVLRRLREIYELAILGRNDGSCDIIHTPTYSMFVLHRQDIWTADEHRFLLDWWRERMLGNGYVAYMSDLRGEVMDGGNRKFTERHYLKPDIFEAMKNGEPVDRRFGNLTLELILNRKEVNHLKLTQAFYHERGREPEPGMERLMEVLLK